MINTTTAYKEQVKKLPQDYRMTIEVVFDESVGIEQTVVIPPDDIFESGYSDEVFLSAFTVGTSASPQFWVRIFNKDGVYKNNALASAEIRPYFTLYDWLGNITDKVPVGVFYTNKLNTLDTDLRIECIDKMRLCEKPFDVTDTKRTIHDIALSIAHTVRADLVNTFRDYPLLRKVVNDKIFSGYSRRQVLELIAECLGTFAVFNVEGNLEFKWFKKVDVELHADWANKPLELNGNTFSLDGNAIRVTGVRVINEDTELAVSGSDEYMLTINENPIAALYPNEVVDNILKQMDGLNYIPCKWTRIGGDPSLQIGDILTIVDNKEPYNEEDRDNYDKYPLYMTSRSWRFNGAFCDNYYSEGEAKRDFSYPGMTMSKRQAQLAKRITESTKEILADMDNREKALFLFNEAIVGSLGLYVTVKTNEDKSKNIFLHDKPTLEDSKTIYTFGANGFAWTDTGWQGDYTLWQYGFDKNGNAILNAIYAYTLSADVITSGLLQSKNGASYINMDDGSFSFSIAEIVDKWYDDEGVHYEYDYEKVLELSDKVLNIYGILKSTKYPNLSVAIGQSENGNEGAFTITDNSAGYGDLFQVYGVGRGTEKGVTWTAPFLINSAKTNRKGISILPNEISLFNDAESGYTAIANGQVSFYIHHDTIGVASKHRDYIFFNYYPPKFGYAPKTYIFGNGAQGGRADVECQDVIVKGSGVLDGYLYVDGKELWDGYAAIFGGQAIAEKWEIYSNRDKKENIIEKKDLNALGKVNQLKFYSYDFKRTEQDKVKTVESDKFHSAKSTADDINAEITPVHIEMGIMTDEAPKEILALDGEGIDLYSYISLVAKAVQELSAENKEINAELEEKNNKIADLEKQLAELRR